MKEQVATPLSPGFHFLKNAPTIGSATTPMGIPSGRDKRLQLRRDPSYTPSKSPSSSRRSSISSSDRPMPSAFTSMLNATAIPVPRRSWSTSKQRRKLRGSQVDEFSRLIQAPLKSKEDYMTAGVINSPLDILLSPLEEDTEKYQAASESGSEPTFSVQSLSSDSMSSLDHDVGSPSSIPQPPTPGSQKSPSERRHLRYSLSEDCALDHPLLETDDSDFDLVIEDSTLDEVPTKQASSRSFPRLRSSFKSNLTASLRAIKSAAQSVSTFATPSVQPDDFLTRSLFTITPEMTDDRRPLPMQEPPSPALRRYLNPTSISPAEMYVYHDHPHDSPSNQACVSIQMQTYRRSRSRGHRRNHFQVISTQNRDKFHTYDPESPPISRQREPRENSDFLRMVVLEMNMRRHGKLREDVPTRAHIWLPPRKSNPYRLSLDFEDCDDDGAVPVRWVGVSA
ncbi:hypothetical protein N7495_005214 [Penicillium taxi]|uniref:uncharacterized protein n=1 Tax=Penicillium taxi TaxID=168475 RepID=UPI002545318E|nr:uncharacterized protein N7495_005214 [Penicillium taxi]KAJ5893523.1 hypothetical protein N7495_005214 [Penicillium taxi]